MNLALRKNWKRRFLAIPIVLTGIGGVLMAFACAATGATPSGDAIERMKISPNYREDRFVNTLPVTEPPMFKAIKEWIKGGDHTVPQNPVSVVKRDKEDFETLPQSGLRITWIGHSTTLVEIDGVRLLLDPIWSERSSPYSRTGPKRFHGPPLALDDLPHIDAVLISHDHYDHLDKWTVIQLAGKGYRFAVPLGVGARLRGWDIPDTQIQELDWWDEIKVKAVTVTATPARHFSGRSLVMADRDETLWAGFAVVGPEHRVYYTGDTGMFPGFREIGNRLGPFDVVMAETGAYNQLWADMHLGPEQAVQAVKDAQGKLMIPVHWGTFDLALHAWTEPAERVIVAAAEQAVPLAIPRPGESVEPSKPLPLLRWWPSIPWQTAEQHPVVSSGLSQSVQQ
ncbi:MAG: MBL fold metallo-hydrolase [Myxococcota bacterium]|nr:MBL fold metallo-hydrolase [Myxococcota bacterium]